MPSRRIPIDDHFSDAVTDIVDTRVMDAHEVADLIGKSTRHARRYIGGEMPFTAAMITKLAHECWRRGDPRLMNLLIPDGTTLTPVKDGATNNDIDDELGELTQYAGRMRESMLDGDRAAALQWQQKIKEVVQRAELEIDRMRIGGR